ncbi:MAG: hypothetical protein ACMXYD_01300 [Candidatus Woesearchaeota archaeon]
MRVIFTIVLLLAGCVTEIPQTQEEVLIPAINPYIDAGILGEEKPHLQETLIFVLTDREQAVRTSLRAGEELSLPTNPPITIQVYSVSAQEAEVSINEEKQTIQKGEVNSYLRGQIKLYAAELHP